MNFIPKTDLTPDEIKAEELRQDWLDSMKLNGPADIDCSKALRELYIEQKNKIYKERQKGTYSSYIARRAYTGTIFISEIPGGLFFKKYRAYQATGQKDG